MTLESDTDLKVENPSADQIRDAVAELPNREGSFVILSSSSRDYIQAAADRKARFTLEYQEGDNTRHFRAKEKLPQASVADVLVGYCRGDSKWKATVTWQHETSGTTSPVLITVFHILWVIGLIMMLPALVVRGQWVSSSTGTGLGIMCLACIANIISAVLHQRMWGRYSVVTPDNIGGLTMFRVFMFLYALFAVIFALGSVRFGWQIK